MRVYRSCSFHLIIIFYLMLFSRSFLSSISTLITHPPSHPPSLPLYLHHSPSFFTLSSLSHPSLPLSLSHTPPPSPHSHPPSLSLTLSPLTTRTPGPNSIPSHTHPLTFCALPCPLLHVPQGLKHQGGRGIKGADSEAPERLKWKLIKEQLERK